MLKTQRNDACWCGSGLKYKKCHLEKADLLLAYARRGYVVPPRGLIKSPEAIQGIKRSAVITRGILDEMTRLIQPGVTTRELDDWAMAYTLQNGGIPAPLGYRGFPKGICTSINQVLCHGIPDETKLKSGDIINIDVTTILDGYYSDASRMYTVGAVSPDAQRLVDCTKEALAIGVQAVTPYQPFNVIGEKIEAYATAQGYSVSKTFGGHGIGLAFHEEPFVCHFKMNEPGMIMVPGMVFTIEPILNQGDEACDILQDGWTAVTVDGGLSAQWEHTVVITETGVAVIV